MPRRARRALRAALCALLHPAAARASASTCWADPTNSYDCGVSYTDPDTDWPLMHGSACAGNRQSPISIPGSTCCSTDGTQSLSAVMSYVSKSSLKFKNTGHDFKVAGEFGTTTVGGHTYDVSGFYLHFPSEHTIDGAHYAGEMQIMHQQHGSTGNADLLIISIFLDTATTDANSVAFFNSIGFGGNIPASGGEYSIPGSVAPHTSLSTALAGDYYRYDGSMTTPPCTESVSWFVMKTPVQVTTAQVNEANAVYPAPWNNRPTQGINGRAVVRNYYTVPHAHRSHEPKRCKLKSMPSSCSSSSSTSSSHGREAQVLSVSSSSSSSTTSSTCHAMSSLGHFGHGAEVVLVFPFITLLLGVFTSWFCRKTPFPYTAWMLLEGCIVGMIHRSSSTENECSQKVFVDFLDWGMNSFSESIDTWIQIQPHLMLYVFLPALLFGDAAGTQVYVFRKVFTQCLWLATIGVLAGSALAACLVHYGPYEYDWFFSMMVGAIVSATDPVAVVALLNDMGAKPRITNLIAGESLLNDGTAIVLFTLFLEMYGNCVEVPDGCSYIVNHMNGDLKIPAYLSNGSIDYTDHHGTDRSAWGNAVELAKCGGAHSVDKWAGTAAGVGYCKAAEDKDAGDIITFFLQMALGGPCIGWCFGMCLICWLAMKRHAVCQIVLTIAFAYMTFYVAEAKAGASGVLATVALAMVVADMGWPVMVDSASMRHVWHTIEFIGNTLIFTLAGAITGTIWVSADDYGITGKDWGWCVGFWVFLSLIRMAVNMCSFPVLWWQSSYKLTAKDMVIASWGGLRGAVGLAMCIMVMNTPGIHHHDGALLMFHVSGLAFLTLWVNAPSCGPMLKFLGLLKISKSEHMLHEVIEKKVAKHFEYLLDDCMQHTLGEVHEGEDDMNMSGMRANTEPAHHPHTLSPTDKAGEGEKMEDAGAAGAVSPPVMTQFERTLSQLGMTAGRTSGSIVTASKTRRMKKYAQAEPDEIRDIFQRIREPLEKDGEDGAPRSALDPADLPDDPEMLALVRRVFLHAVKERYEDLVDEGLLHPGRTINLLLFTCDYAEDEEHCTQPLADWSVLKMNLWPEEDRDNDDCLTGLWRSFKIMHDRFDSCVYACLQSCLNNPEGSQEFRHAMRHIWDLVELTLRGGTPHGRLAMLRAYVDAHATALEWLVQADYLHNHTGEEGAAAGPMAHASADVIVTVIKESQTQVKEVMDRIAQIRKDQPGVAKQVQHDQLKQQISTKLGGAIKKQMDHGLCSRAVGDHLLHLITKSTGHVFPH